MRKNNNRILLIILVILGAVFVITKVFRAPALKSNLDTERFAIDTSLIQSLHVIRSGQPELKLEKVNAEWVVTEGKKRANAESTSVNNFLLELQKAKPERIVSRREDKWTSYQVNDSASIRMRAFDVDNEPVIDWHIGRESQGSTYVRPADEDEIYAMTGNLRSGINKDFNHWRDKTFLQIKPASVAKVTFTYPSDSGFVLQKNNGAWMLDNQKADSAQVERYLLKLQSRNLRDFLNGEVPSRDADITLSIDTADGSPVVVKAWKESDVWTLNSSFQPDVYFRDGRIDDDLFVRKSVFRSVE